MDENNQGMQVPKEPTKKEKAQQAGADVAQVAAKGAANHFGGPLAGKAVDALAKTKTGQKMLNNAGKQLSRNPIARQALSKAQPRIAKAKPNLNAAAGGLGGSGIGTNKSAFGTASASRLGGTSKLGSNASSLSSNSQSSSTSNASNSPFSSKTNTSNSSSGGFGSRLKNSLFNNTGAVGAVADYNSAHNVNGFSSGIDILDGIVTFIKNNPGLIFAIFVGLLITAIMLLPIILIASAVMFGLTILSSFVKGLGNTLADIAEIYLNTKYFWEGNAFKTNENAYYDNLNGQADYYFNNEDVHIDESEINETGFKAYINAATFYSNVVNPDVIIDDDSYEPNSTENDEVDNEEINTADIDVDMFIGDSITLRAKFALIKNDPKKLAPEMFECEDSSEEGISKECHFSEDKYKEYLTNNYVMDKYVNCGNCGFETATDEQKKSASKKMAEEIISQARSVYVNSNANDQSNYNAYSIMVSGITVKDNDGNVVGTYSFSEYIQAIVERDAGAYNNEIKKAYALVVISRTLANSSNGEVIEDDFDFDKVTQSTVDAVEAVIDLKIMKDGKVYTAPFDFEKAQQVVPQEYKAILEALYGEDISIEESISNGLQLDTSTGFYMRVQPPDKNDPNYYGGNAIGFIGECAWYATNRAREITRTLGVYEWTANPNGNNFCYQADASHFNTCWPSKGEKCSPKQGAIVSFGYTTGDYVAYGHVGIIEKVDGNNVTYSDSASSRGIHGFKKVNENGSLRYENCTSNPNKSCVNTQQKTTISGLSTGGDGRYIICYIYLTEQTG